MIGTLILAALCNLVFLLGRIRLNNFTLKKIDSTVLLAVYFLVAMVIIALHFLL